MSDKKDVVFRRIRGRIVPIKLTADQKSRLKAGAQGTALVGAGVAIAATSGNFYRKAVMKSADKAMKALIEIQNIGDILKKSGPQQTLFDYAKRTDQQRAAFESLRKSKQIANASKFLKAAAIPVGAGLVTAGALRALSAVPNQKKRQIDPALVAGGSAAVAVIAPKAANLAKEAFTAGIGGKQGVFKFGSSKMQKVIPHIKNAGHSVLKALL